MKSKVSYLIVLILLMLGSIAFAVLARLVWPGPYQIVQIPVGCRVVVALEGLVWLVTCIVFGMPIARYVSPMIARAFSLLLRRACIWITKVFSLLRGRASFAFTEMRLGVYWRMMHTCNVIVLRRRLVIAVVLVTVLWSVICTFAALPIYSATCTIEDLTLNHFSDRFVHWK